MIINVLPRFYESQCILRWFFRKVLSPTSVN